jgi:predicted phage tail protein
MGQKAWRFVHEVSDFASATGRHLRNRTKGYYYFAARKVNDVGHMIKPGADGEASDASSRAVQANVRTGVAD